MVSNPDNTSGEHFPKDQKLTPTVYLEAQTHSLYYTMNWREQAECRLLDPEQFFPTNPDEVPLLARAACYRCPVRLYCLTYALATHQNSGIWGGTSSKGRKKMRRKLFTALRTMRRREEEEDEDD